jgi:hypothetical protein
LIATLGLGVAAWAPVAIAKPAAANTLRRPISPPLITVSTRFAIVDIAPATRFEDDDSSDLAGSPFLVSLRETGAEKRRPAADGVADGDQGGIAFLTTPPCSPSSAI